MTSKSSSGTGPLAGARRRGVETATPELPEESDRVVAHLAVVLRVHHLDHREPGIKVGATACDVRGGRNAEDGKQKRRGRNKGPRAAGKTLLHRAGVACRALLIFALRRSISSVSW